MNETLATITDLHIGKGVSIAPDADFTGLRKLSIGDYSTIGPGVRCFGGGEFTVGDYAKIHRGVSVCTAGHVRLGHVAWVGQDTHLDGSGGIDAGDFLGVGIGSSLYSHIRHGDLTEGCNFEKFGHLAIGNDVWFVGMVLVSPVRCEDKSMALLGSVVTRNMRTNRLYAGNPAEDVTDTYRRTPYREKSVDEKRATLEAYLREYFESVAPAAHLERVRVVEAFPEVPETGVTYYNLGTRSYTKTHHPEEVALNRWLFSARAKFRPV